jgi:hypothetical protein
VIVILTVNDNVISYATPALQPLLHEETGIFVFVTSLILSSGRALIVKCLYTKLQNQFLSNVAQPFGTGSPFCFTHLPEDEALPVIGKERKMDDYPYIEDTQQCIEVLKTKFMELREKVH